MKKMLLSGLAAVLFLAACNSGEKKEKSTDPPESKKTDTALIPPAEIKPDTVQLYACPMHPEVTGKKDEKCPKCGMKLTEPVPQKQIP